MNRALLVLALILASCASAAPPSPGERAVREARREIGTALGAGIEAIEYEAPYRLLARFNPTQHPSCACPRFEVLYLGSWHRVFLEPSEDEVSTWLEDYAVDAAFLPQEPDIMLLGQPTENARRCEGSQQRFTVFTVERAERL